MANQNNSIYGNSPLSQVMTGSRGVVSIDGVVVGIFDSCSYGEAIGHEAIHILGAFAAQEITPTSYEAISVTCTGFRVINNGVHTLPKFPRLRDILNLGSVQITVFDRQTGENMATIFNCVPVGYNTGVNARATSRVSITYMGIRVEDESNVGDSEVNNPATLP